MRLGYRFGALLSGCALVTGCAGMIAGSPSWFDKQKPDVQGIAQTDLACSQPIEFKPTSGDDYRDVEARGCGKKARYQLVKVSFVSKWVKSGEVTSL